MAEVGEVEAGSSGARGVGSSRDGAGAGGRRRAAAGAAAGETPWMEGSCMPRGLAPPGAAAAVGMSTVVDVAVVVAATAALRLPPLLPQPRRGIVRA